MQQKLTHPNPHGQTAHKANHILKPGHPSKKREQMGKYVKEGMPKKPYTRRIVFREREKGKIYTSDIVFAVMIIAMLAILFYNYLYVRDYVAPVKNQTAIKEIDVSVKIVPEKKLEAYCVEPIKIQGTNPDLGF